MSNLDRYLSGDATDIHPLWLMVPGALCAAVILWLKLSGGEPEPIPLVTLPDPYVPQCYWVEGRPTDYCEFKVGRK